MLVLLRAVAHGMVLVLVDRLTLGTALVSVKEQLYWTGGAASVDSSLNGTLVGSSTVDLLQGR